MEELDLSKTIDFEVVGDIKPTIEKYVPYLTEMNSDCTVQLKGTTLGLPAYWRYLTYRGWYWWNKEENSIDKKIITDLYSQGLIKIHEVRD